MRDFRNQNFDGKKIILRLDLNVPMNSSKNIVDNSRILASIPTIDALINMNAKIIIISHLGRPKNFNKSIGLSMMPVYEELQALLPNYNIYFAPDIDSAKYMSDGIKNKDIIMIENIRYYSGEETGDEELAKKIASLGDYYVNDAFSCSHRNHASVSVITRYIDSFPGLLMKKEIDSLNIMFNESCFKKRIGIIGGGKVSSKIDLLKSLSENLDVLMIGGAMANTFLKAKGYDIGASVYEESHIRFAFDIMNNAKARIILPIDATVATKDQNISRLSNILDIQSNEYIGDIGPNTVKLFQEEIRLACIDGSNLRPEISVIWNGPLGIVEDTKFDKGSIELAKFIGEMTIDGKICSIAGGGDVVYAINKAGVRSEFTYISTAGGAFLEWLEGKDLPGIIALDNYFNKII